MESNIKSYDLGYLMAVLDNYASYYIVYNKVNDIRGTYDPSVQICIKRDHVLKKTSALLKLMQIPHSIKHYKSYALVVITSIYTINDFLKQINPYIDKTERYKILEEFVLLRVSKNMGNLKSRYGDEELALWRKMKMLGKKTEFVKAERVS